MPDIKYEIIEKIGVLSKVASGGQRSQPGQLE